MRERRWRHSAPVPRARSRCVTIVLGLPAEGPAVCHGVLIGYGGLRRRVCVAVACEGLPYKGAGRVPPAAQGGSRCQALMVGADGQERHQCPGDDALDEAEATSQIGQYPR
jgi:hypothetical protein